MTFTTADLVRAARAFQESYESDVEHGVSDDEAARGVLAALHKLGLAEDANVEEIRAEWARQQAEEQRVWREREAARRAALTPEKREIEDEFRKSLMANQTAMLDSLFKTAPLFGVLRAKK